MTTSTYVLILFHIVLLTIALSTLYRVIQLEKTKEGYYLGEYYKLKQCRCIPQYDKVQFTNYN
jgi:hypothetical protein